MTAAEPRSRRWRSHRRSHRLRVHGAGDLAGRYLRSFWQPVALAADLPPGHAKPLRVMSEDFTLYRGEDGAPHVVAPRCAHRGTQLSTGWVEGDCLRCFYHGWKYDAAGQCVEMPAEDPAFPPKVRIASYPDRGVSRAHLRLPGRGRRHPPFPRYPEFEAEGVLTPSTYVRDCNYFNALENSHDPVHLAFVHRRSAFTENGLIGVPTVEAEETPWGVAIHATRRGGTVRTVQFCMPNMTRRTSPPDDPAETRWQEALAWRVPIDDTAYRSFNLDLAFLTGEPADRFRHLLDERAAIREAGRLRGRARRPGAARRAALRRDQGPPATSSTFRTRSPRSARASSPTATSTAWAAPTSASSSSARSGSASYKPSPPAAPSSSGSASPS